jgi:hypothetical protein
MQMLQHLDRRLLLVEWCLSPRRRGCRRSRASARRTRRGAANRGLSKIEVGSPLFDENNLFAGELVGLRVIKGWLRAAGATSPPSVAPPFRAGRTTGYPPADIHQGRSYRDPH